MVDKGTLRSGANMRDLRWAQQHTVTTRNGGTESDGDGPQWKRYEDAVRVHVAYARCRLFRRMDACGDKFQVEMKSESLVPSSQAASQAPPKYTHAQCDGSKWCLRAVPSMVP
jgi:hypothetical protein